MKLVVVRHLPTEWNLADKLQGRADISISPPDDAEKKRIEDNRVKLETFEPFDKVVCSTLKRTRETAALYGYQTIERNPLLDEFDFGRFEGASRKDFMAEIGGVWISQPETVVLGESIIDLERRVRDFLKHCHSQRCVLAFTHGCWVRALKSIHETGDVRCMNQTHVRNNEIHVFEFQESL